MSASRFWEITCDAIVQRGEKVGECGLSGDHVEWYLKEVRRRAKRDGWTRGPNGEDYCPEHPHGRARRPAEPGG